MGCFFYISYSYKKKGWYLINKCHENKIKITQKKSWKVELIFYLIHYNETILEIGFYPSWVYLNFITCFKMFK